MDEIDLKTQIEELKLALAGVNGITHKKMGIHIKKLEFRTN